MDPFTAEHVAKALGLELGPANDEAPHDEKDDAKHKAKPKEADRRVRAATAGEMAPVAYADTDANGQVEIDILGASTANRKHTRSDLYNDAALSFTRVLKTGVYPKGQARSPLQSPQREAFREWIDLLYWTLPPTWKLHTLINDVRLNVDHALGGSDYLSDIVDRHHEVVNENVKGWSDSCRKGQKDKDAGYTCGLWSLLHIMSVGVLERHSAVLGGRDRVSTRHAADTLAGFVSNFFDWCDACQTNFAAMYGKCGYNHCKRFRQGGKNNRVPPAKETWKEFPLWLWEVHNGVNERVAKEEAERHNGRKATIAELENTKWPSRDACRHCYRKDGKFDEEEVLSYLKAEYWPGGVQNFRFVVLDKKKNVPVDDNYGMSRMLPTVVFISSVAAIGVVSAWAWRRRMLAVTGRHKKFESDSV